MFTQVGVYSDQEITVSRISEHINLNSDYMISNNLTTPS
jgi:hypothetical protein